MLLLTLKAILAVAFFFCHFVVASVVVMGCRRPELQATHGLCSSGHRQPEW